MKRWFSLVVVLLFSLPFVVGQGAVDDVSESGDSLRYDRAVELTTDGVRELFMRSDAEAAYALFSEAIASDSTYAPAKYSIAELLMLSTPEIAVKYAAEAYASDTTNHWYLNRYAQSMISAGRYAQSRILFERLLELRPLDLNAYRVLALLYQQDSQLDRAIQLLDTAELRVGYNPYLMSIKRQLLLTTNQTERAIEEAQVIVANSPNMAEGRVALAELYGDIGRDSLAEAEYRAAMLIDSTRIESLISMGNYQQKRGQTIAYMQTLQRLMRSADFELRGKIGLIEEVMSNRALYQANRMYVNSLITTLLIVHPNNSDVVRLQIKHLIAMGMLEEAASVAKSRIDDEPLQEEYYRYVVDIERYMGRVDSVSLYLKRAVDRMPNNSTYRLELAYMFVEQHRYDVSIEMFKREAEGATDSLQSTIWGTIGDIEHQRRLYSLERDSMKMEDLSLRKAKGVMRQVYKYYDKALALNMDNPLVLNNYSYFMSEYGGDLDRALEMAKRANELVGGNPTYIDTYGWVLYRLGHYEEAKVQMRRAISLDRTNNYEIALHYGEILWVLGEATMAEFYWSKSLQWGASEVQVERSRSRAEIKRDDI